jgi:hypothetical protein
MEVETNTTKRVEDEEEAAATAAAAISNETNVGAKAEAPSVVENFKNMLEMFFRNLYIFK